MNTNFFDKLKDFPRTYLRLIQWIDCQMVEPAKTIEQERELIYKFIKRMGFRVHMDFLAIQEKVVVTLYFVGEFINGYETVNNQNEIYRNLFIDSFEEMEKWHQEVSLAMLEEKFKQSELLEL